MHMGCKTCYAFEGGGAEPPQHCVANVLIKGQEEEEELSDVKGTFGTLKGS